jgi:hypothetical protein
MQYNKRRKFMHEITGDKKVVRSILKDTIAHLRQSDSRTKKTAAKALSLSGKKAKKAAGAGDVAAVLQAALNKIEGKKGASAAGLSNQAARGERAVGGMYAPRDQTIALIQSAMDEYLDDVVGPASTGGAAKGGKKTAKAAAANKVISTGATQAAFYKGGKVQRPARRQRRSIS